MRGGSEAGLYLRLIDCFITELEAQGASRTCNEDKEEEQIGGVERVAGRCGRVSMGGKNGESCSKREDFRIYFRGQGIFQNSKRISEFRAGCSPPAKLIRALT